jgi:hypothetical protein
MVRTDRFKYLLSGDNDEAFFDLAADPYELHNLVGDDRYAEQIRDHRQRLAAWMETIGDTHARPPR